MPGVGMQICRCGFSPGAGFWKGHQRCNRARRL